MLFHFACVLFPLDLPLLWDTVEHVQIQTSRKNWNYHFSSMQQSKIPRKPLCSCHGCRNRSSKSGLFLPARSFLKEVSLLSGWVDWNVACSVGLCKLPKERRRRTRFEVRHRNTYMDVRIVGPPRLDRVVYSETSGNRTCLCDLKTVT